MYTGFQHLHSYLAYFVLATIAYSILYVTIKFVKKSTFSEKVRKVTLIAFIASHVQLLVGLVIYVISPLGLSNLSSEAMGGAISRLYALEHPLVMIIAILLISVGYIKAKKPGDDARRFKTIILFYGMGLLLMLTRIPWQVWP